MEKETSDFQMLIMQFIWPSVILEGLLYSAKFQQ